MSQKYEQTVLANGLRILSHQMKERDSVSIGVWMDTGGRHEDVSNKGVAHFLEHIVFKGSRNYSCEEIKSKIEGVGGTLNAFTTEEITCYYAKIPHKHLPATFDILTDMTFFPKITKRDVEREQGVIIEEIKMYRDLPQYHVLEELDHLVWPKHSLGRPLAGTTDTVSAMTSRTIKNFHQRDYVARRAVISACGRVSHSELVKMGERQLAGITAGQESSFEPAEINLKQRVRLVHRPVEQMHVAIGAIGYPEEHKDRYVLNLLHILLGGNMSSRLFNEVREKRGLAYSISTTVKGLRDTGLFMVRAGIDNIQIVEAVKLIISELGRIGRGRIKDDELKRAKDYYAGQIQLGLEDTLEHMFWVGEAILTSGKFRNMGEVLKRIRQVSAEDLKRVAKEVLAKDKLFLAVVGPLTDKQSQELKQLAV